MIHLVVFFLIHASCFAQNAAKLENALKKNPDDIKSRIQLANIYSTENKPDKAIELLNPYTDQLTDQGFLLLASSYSKKGEFTDEVRVLNLLVQKDEENYQWHMLLAQAYLKQASGTASEETNETLLTSAIQSLRRVMQLNPKFKPAFDLLLKTFLDQNSNNEARELLMEGINKFGNRSDLFRELCRLDAQDGYLPQAVSHCTESIKIAPNYPDHYVYLVEALHDQKEDQRAEREIVKAGKKFAQSEFVQWAAGELFLRKKNYPVAGRYFQAAVKANPQSGRAQFGLAQALFEQGNAEAALEPFTAACKLFPPSHETFLAATGRLKQKGTNNALAGRYSKAANTCR